MGRDGVLYGVTNQGGTGSACRLGCGTVFSLTPPASAGGGLDRDSAAQLHRGSDGGEPQASVLIGNNGVLYGTTWIGGSSNVGVVFSLTPPSVPGSPWSETVLYNFTGSPDGANPGGALIEDRGVLYGTTAYGGTSLVCPTGCGAFFSLTPPVSQGAAWTENVLSIASRAAVMVREPGIC
jgi:uncharacterized repeat protein (TIGR03803 family)